jgi:prepilin-type N-terminal cleavage/methylation domain-containing protein/prepilin-type processing-associated H-X9-DG protein
MERHCDRVRGAFTLVELLVVIGIIALLISVLLPALNKAREQANITKCAAQLRSIGQALSVYAAANKGKLPQHTFADPNATRPLYWLWDLTVDSRDAILHGKSNSGLQAAGGVRDLLYCPLFYDQNIDNHWNYGGYSVVGYLLTIQRVKKDANGRIVPLTDAEFPPLFNRIYLTKTTDKINQSQADKMNASPALWPQPTWVTMKEKARPMAAAELEVAMDATMSQNDKPFMTWTTQGGSTLRHVSSHMRKGQAIGGNVLFLDGHVVFRPISEMMCRHRPSDASSVTAKNRFYF